MGSLPWQNLLHVVGAANALLLATVLAWSPRLARTRARLLLAAYLSGLGFLLWLFTAVDAGWVGFSKALRVAYDAVALLIPALLLDYLQRAVGRRASPRWTYFPAPAFLVLALIPGDAFLDWFRIEHVIAIQILYSATAVWLLLRTRGRLAVWPRHLVVLVGGVLSIHLAQLLRIMFPDVGWIFDAVPLAGAAYFIALTWMVFTDPRALRRLTEVVEAGRDTHDTDTREAAFTTLDDYVRREAPYLDPGLTLESLAAAAETSPRRLSALINEATGAGFYDYVNGHRVAAARRLLEDAAEQRTSVEAIGLMVGFRSRSTFYEAFKRQTGMTPAAWRKARRD